MEIVNLKRDEYERWDAFCLESDEAWFWHTSRWLDYHLMLRPQIPTESRSFLVAEGQSVLGVCPLILEARDKDGINVKELAYDGGPCPAPALANGLSPKARSRVLGELMETVDQIATESGAVRAALRASPLSPASLGGRASWPSMLARYGYLDVSLSTQVLSLVSTEGELLRGMRKGHRSDIKRSAEILKTEVFDAETLDWETFRLYQEMHHKAAGRRTRPEETFEAMYRWVKAGEAILAGAMLGDRWVGFIHVNMYKDGAYYGSSANDPEYAKLPISHSIQWAIIRWLKTQGIHSYELGWQQVGPLPHGFPSEKEIAISLFKRGFGGETLPLFAAEKYYSARYYRQVQTERVERYAASIEQAAVEDKRVTGGVR